MMHPRLDVQLPVARVDRDAITEEADAVLLAMGLVNVTASAIVAIDLEGLKFLAGKFRDEFEIKANFRKVFAARMIAYLTATGSGRAAAELQAQADQLGIIYDKDIPTMSTEQQPTKPSTLETAQDYGAEVLYWTTAMQLTKRARGLLADALTQHLKGKARATKRQMVLALLDGPAGGPLVALALSGLLTQGASMTGQNGPKVEHLAKILRLHAGESVANELTDKLFEFVLPAKDALTQALSSLPEPSANHVLFDAETREKVPARG